MSLLGSEKTAYSMGRSARSQSAHRWSRRSKLLLIGLGFASICIFFLVLFFGVRVYSLNKENASLRTSLQQSERELQRLRPEVRQLRQDISDLVEGRIPRLKRLEYDKVIDLDAGYVKKIVFTLTRSSQTTYYEYKLVMENDTSFVIWPDVKVYFFNESGIQVGVAEIGSSQDALSPEGRHSLASGEVRSYSSSITVDEDEVPAYFLVRVQGEGEHALRYDDDADYSD